MTFEVALQDAGGGEARQSTAFAANFGGATIKALLVATKRDTARANRTISMMKENVASDDKL